MKTIMTKAASSLMFVLMIIVCGNAGASTPATDPTQVQVQIDPFVWGFQGENLAGYRIDIFVSNIYVAYIDYHDQV